MEVKDEASMQRLYDQQLKEYYLARNASKGVSESTSDSR